MRYVAHSLALVLALTAWGGCSKSPATWSKSDIEAYLEDKLSLTDVTLTEDPDGGYTGTGTAEDGTQWKLSVTQDEKVDQLSYSAKSEQDKVKSGGVFRPK